MSRKILLDANTAIPAFDPQPTTAPEKIAAAKNKLAAWLRDDGIALATTPLIVYEVLRGAPADSSRWQELKEALAGLESFEIRHETGEVAARLWQSFSQRAEQDGNRDKINKEKRNFDILHVATAHVEGLELAADDNHIPNLKALLIETLDNSP